MNGQLPEPELTVRPVAGDDEPRVLRLLARLSDQSVYRRFFTLFPSPPPSVLAQLVKPNDNDHGELVAVDHDEIVAVASWDRVRGASREAEVAVVVDDEWQHRGIGRALMRMVTADARRHGIAALTASVLSDNHPAKRLARSAGEPATVAFDGPTTVYTYCLAS